MEQTYPKDFVFLFYRMLLCTSYRWLGSLNVNVYGSFVGFISVFNCYNHPCHCLFSASMSLSLPFSQDSKAGITKLSYPHLNKPPRSLSWSWVGFSARTRALWAVPQFPHGSGLGNPLGHYKWSSMHIMFLHVQGVPKKSPFKCIYNWTKIRTD